VFARPDGSVAVSYCVEDRAPAETEQEYLARLVRLVPPTAEETLPDGSYTRAWFERASAAHPVRLETQTAYQNRIEAKLREPAPNKAGELVAAIPADWVRVAALDAATVPADRTFRNAWKYASGFGVDMPAARELWRGRIRRDRGAEFARLDADYLRADEAGDDQAKADIAAEKQRLRDAPAHPDIEAAATPEQLKAVRVEGLPRSNV
jgi:hypothetical protein